MPSDQPLRRRAFGDPHRVPGGPVTTPAPQGRGIDLGEIDIPNGPPINMSNFEVGPLEKVCHLCFICHSGECL